MPPEPIRYVGAHMVRAAIRRKDDLNQRSKRIGPIVRALSAMAPGGITTSTVKKERN